MVKEKSPIVHRVSIIGSDISRYRERSVVSVFFKERVNLRHDIPQGDFINKDLTTDS